MFLKVRASFIFPHSLPLINVSLYSSSHFLGISFTCKNFIKTDDTNIFMLLLSNKTIFLFLFLKLIKFRHMHSLNKTILSRDRNITIDIFSIMGVICTMI